MRRAVVAHATVAVAVASALLSAASCGGRTGLLVVEGLDAGDSGMGFVADSNDTGETLFVADSAFTAMGKSLSTGLASIDTMAFGLSFVGPFTPPIPGPELTGTGDGRLFAFFTNAAGSGSHIVEVDKHSGNLLADNPLQVGSPNDGYAFAFWGGTFWVFTEQRGPSQVTQFNPADSSETPMTTMPGSIVGAGVSTCAPM